MRLVHAITITALVNLTGCYEGWEYYGQGGLPNIPTPEPPATAPYAYILFQPILMSAGATNSATCFPETTIRDFKSTEWNERVTSLTEGLRGITSKLVVNAISIAASDCNTMNDVTIAALDSEPWSPDDPPEQDSLGRPAVHLKTAFWEGEPISSPSQFVSDTDWSAWSNLAGQGRFVFSAHHFVISNTNNGYFTQWQDSLNSDYVFNGTAIDTVDPTPTGITNRTNTIADDTTKLVEWLAAGGPF